MEKPVAVDAPGVRRVLRAGKLAEQKGLAIAVESDERDLGFGDFTANGEMALRDKQGRESRR